MTEPKEAKHGYATYSASHSLYNEQTLDTVNARDLHTFLELGRHFNTWINARIKRYCFIDGEDFKGIENLSFPKWGSTKSRVQKVKDYFLTLDMAKELAMSNATKRANKPAATSSTAKNNSTSKNTFPPPQPTSL